MGPMMAVLPMIMTAVSTIAPMLMGGGKGGGGGGDQQQPSFQQAPAAPTKSDADIQEQEKAERLRRSKASGVSSTNRTSGLGITEDPLVAKPTLLGE